MVEDRASSVILKRAFAFPWSGEWNDDDFDVRADGAVVGRITASEFEAHDRGGRTRILPSLDGKAARP